MKKILTLISALCLGLALASCEDRRDDRQQPGEAIEEGADDVKRSADDVTEGSDNDLEEGASDMKRGAEDATD